jgi:hypothetical protein
MGKCLEEGDHGLFLVIFQHCPGQVETIKPEAPFTLAGYSVEPRISKIEISSDN